MTGFYVFPFFFPPSFVPPFGAAARLHMGLLEISPEPFPPFVGIPSVLGIVRDHLSWAAKAWIWEYFRPPPLRIQLFGPVPVTTSPPLDLMWAVWGPWSASPPLTARLRRPILFQEPGCPVLSLPFFGGYPGRFASGVVLSLPPLFESSPRLSEASLFPFGCSALSPP